MKTKRWFEQIKDGIPFQYLVKQAPFFKHDFFVDQRVLIPRPESEILVELVLNHLKKTIPHNSNQNKLDYHIAEIGIGSGALLTSIICELKLHFHKNNNEMNNIHFVGTDISQDCIDVSKINLLRKRISNNIFRLIKTDKLLGITNSFDLIYSNPPYIIEEDSTATVQVTKWEPSIALFLKKNQYHDWMMDLIEQSLNHLNSNGLFIMEGHELELPKIWQTVKEQNLHFCKTVKDYNNQIRFLIIQKR